MRKDYLGGEVVETIYLGGGTPTTLEVAELKEILQVLNSEFQVSETIEQTIEANPEDLNEQYLDSLLEIGFDRISIGLQSLDDEELKQMNRRHDAKRGLNAVELAKRVGYDNISIDLIYGNPGSDINRWKNTLKGTIDLNVKHISAYHLTIEPKTTFHRWVKNGIIKEISDEMSLGQFELMKEMFEKGGYIQYEISSFGKPGFFSKHNCAYWDQSRYLGIGPSAHSFNGVSRQWNIAHNQKYLDALERDSLPGEMEVLSEDEKIKDYLLTGLRTMWGVNMDKISGTYGEEQLLMLIDRAKPFVERGDLEISNRTIKISDGALFVTDHIITGLFPPG